MSVTLNAVSAANRSESILGCMIAVVIASMLPVVTLLISKIACTHATKREWLLAAIYAGIAAFMLALSIGECKHAFTLLLKDDVDHALMRAVVFDGCMVAFEVAHVLASKKSK
jgi:hypothetical protein